MIGAELMSEDALLPLPHHVRFANAKSGMDENASDSELLACFIEKNGAESHAAFAFLYMRHRPWVFGKAYRICKSSHAAEDVCQTTFLKLYLHAHTITGSVTGWLNAVVVSESLTYLKVQRKGILMDEPAFTTEQDQLGADEERDPVEALYAEPFRRLNDDPDFLQTIQELSFRDRFTLWCKYHIEVEDVAIAYLSGDVTAVNLTRTLFSRTRKAFLPSFSRVGLLTDTSKSELNNKAWDGVLSAFGPAYDLAIRAGNELSAREFDVLLIHICRTEGREPPPFEAGPPVPPDSSEIEQALQNVRENCARK